MKVLLLTVAGLSARFGKSVGQECLKCIYFELDYKESLLWQIINKDLTFNKIVIVGGYKFYELNSFIDTYLQEFKNKIILVKNEKYSEYGSGYSLYKGLEKCLTLETDQILFAEGDLWTDKESFRELSDSPYNCVTYNHELIQADKSVVFYFNACGNLKYLYDVSHNLLEINEPFTAVYNSGQMWKFVNLTVMKRVFQEFNEEDWQGTNLIFVQRYFENIDSKELKIIPINRWINCNTIADFRKVGDNK